MILDFIGHHIGWILLGLLIIVILAKIITQTPSQRRFAKVFRRQIPHLYNRYFS